MRSRIHVSEILATLVSVQCVLAGPAGPALAAQPTHRAAAPTDARQRFLDRAAYLLRDSGVWTAVNPDHDSSNAWSPTEFGYQFMEGYGPGQLRLRITGTVGDTTYLYWEGFYYWHPLRNRVAYASLGTGGAVASGETVEAGGALVFELVLPDGRVELHKDEETRISEDVMRSSSFEYVAGAWKPIRTMTWRRVRRRAR